MVLQTIVELIINSYNRTLHVLTNEHTYIYSSATSNSGVTSSNALTNMSM